MQKETCHVYRLARRPHTVIQVLTHTCFPLRIWRVAHGAGSFGSQGRDDLQGGLLLGGLRLQEGVQDKPVAAAPASCKSWATMKP